MSTRENKESDPMNRPMEWSTIEELEAAYWACFTGGFPIPDIGLVDLRAIGDKEIHQICLPIGIIGTALRGWIDERKQREAAKKADTNVKGPE